MELWAAQKRGGTGLCIGLDPHYEKKAWKPGDEGDRPPNQDMYAHFMKGVGGFRRDADGKGLDGEGLAITVESWRRHALPPLLEGRVAHPKVATEFLASVAVYYRCVIRIAWSEGIRVFKLQAGFAERFTIASDWLLHSMVMEIQSLAHQFVEPCFIILDAKRGDIDTTQEAYYDAYFSGRHDEVFPGAMGRFDFNAMTVTSWMGEDVLTPGLRHFKWRKKSAIVVTRSSNPSGTTLQDLYVENNPDARLSDKQKLFRVTAARLEEIEETIRGRATAHDVMLAETARFSAENKLDQDGISPIFSVMGSTVEMNDRFRRLRPGGVALAPGFGAQGGSFRNAMPLVQRDGPMKGHLGILASSREHNFPWMEKYGGSGDPLQLESDLRAGIGRFRAAERQAYQEAGIDWPF